MMIQANEESALVNGTYVSSVSASTSTSGHPDLDPIWIQPKDVTRKTKRYSELSFDPAFGLNTVSSHEQSIMPPIPTATVHHHPQTWHLDLGDADLFVPLPDSIVKAANPAKFSTNPDKYLKFSHEGFNFIDYSPDKDPLDPATPSKQLPMTKIPHKVYPGDQMITNKRRAQRLRLQEQVTSTPIPEPLRPRILKEVIKFSHSSQLSLLRNPKKGTTKKKPTPKTGIPPAVKVMPTKADKPSHAAMDDKKHSFQRPDFNRIYGLMQKLDNPFPSLDAPPSVALQLTLQRQQWLQTWNIIMATLNKEEATNAFTLYAKHLLPPERKK